MGREGKETDMTLTDTDWWCIKRYDKGPHHGHGEPHPINFGAHDDDEYDPDDDPEVQKLRLGIENLNIQIICTNN